MGTGGRRGLTRRGAVLSSMAALASAAGCRTSEEIAPGMGRTLAWTNGSALPFPVQEIYPCAYGGRIHLAGGFVAANGRITGPTARHVAFDPDAGAWADGPDLPRPRHHPQLVSFNGRLWAIGGFESRSPAAGWVMQAGSWALDEAAGEWRDGPALPQPSGECVVADLAGALHLATGRAPKGGSNATWTDHSDVARHYVLVDPGGPWEAARPAPTARNSAAAAVIDGRWHIVGGRTVDDGNMTAHEVYEPTEDRWRAAAPLPQGQGGLAAGILAGRLLAFGGEFFDNGGGVYPECWIYDPATDAWTAGPDMPTPRHGLGGVTLGDVVYAIGGARKRGGEETSTAVELLSSV